MSKAEIKFTPKCAKCGLEGEPYVHLLQMGSTLFSTELPEDWHAVSNRVQLGVHSLEACEAVTYCGNCFGPKEAVVTNRGKCFNEAGEVTEWKVKPLKTKPSGQRRRKIEITIRLARPGSNLRELNDLVGRQCTESLVMALVEWTAEEVERHEVFDLAEGMYRGTFEYVEVLTP